MHEVWKKQQVDEDARKMHRTKICVQKIKTWRRRHLGGHDLVRRMDRQGEVLKRCKKCSVYARQRMGPKLMNCCMPELVGTKDFGKMVKRIQTLEEGIVPAKEAKNWRIEGEKRRTTRKEYRRLLNNFEMEMAQKACGRLQRRR